MLFNWRRGSRRFRAPGDKLRSTCSAPGQVMQDLRHLRTGSRDRKHDLGRLLCKSSRSACPSRTNVGERSGRSFGPAGVANEMCVRMTGYSQCTWKDSQPLFARAMRLKGPKSARARLRNRTIFAGFTLQKLQNRPACHTGSVEPVATRPEVVIARNGTRKYG